MASAVYQLFSQAFKTLSPWAWQQCFERGEIRIVDFNEVGPEGSLLDVVLKSALLESSSGSWSVDKDDGRYAPDPETERLAVWLVGQGCDPWQVHRDRDSWSRAVELGWPRLMTALKNHAGSPGQDVLEQVLVPKNAHANQVLICAPASFAGKNQVDALRAWHGMGFNVNLQVPEGVSAGSAVSTPEFFEAWARAGGQVQARNAAGKTWPERWSFPSAQRHIAMEKAWSKLQDKTAVSPVDAVDSLLSRISRLGKGRVQHEFQQHQINWSSQDSQGVTLRERVLEAFANNPNAMAGSVVDFALAKASPAQVYTAVVAGLKVRTASTKNSVYPNAEQLSSLLIQEKLGPDEKALKELANALKEEPDGVGLGVLFGLSREASRTFAESLDAQSDVASLTGYAKAARRAVVFWTPWFCERDDDGVLKGWKAFAAWAPKAASSNGGVSGYDFWKALVSDLAPSVLLEGKNLLRASEALRRPPLSEEMAGELWDARNAFGSSSWVSPLIDLQELEAPTPDAMRSLESHMWELVFKSDRKSREFLEPLLRSEAKAALDKNLLSAVVSVSRPRM